MPDLFSQPDLPEELLLQYVEAGWDSLSIGDRALLEPYFTRSPALRSALDQLRADRAACRTLPSAALELDAANLVQRAADAIARRQTIGAPLPDQPDYNALPAAPSLRIPHGSLRQGVRPLALWRPFAAAAGVLLAVSSAWYGYVRLAQWRPAGDLVADTDSGLPGTELPALPPVKHNTTADDSALLADARRASARQATAAAALLAAHSTAAPAIDSGLSVNISSTLLRSDLVNMIDSLLALTSTVPVRTCGVVNLAPAADSRIRALWASEFSDTQPLASDPFLASVLPSPPADSHEYLILGRPSDLIRTFREVDSLPSSSVDSAARAGSPSLDEMASAPSLAPFCWSTYVAYWSDPVDYGVLAAPRRSATCPAALDEPLVRSDLSFSLVPERTPRNRTGH